MLIFLLFYVLDYDECRKVINDMKFASDSELFGNEKDDSFKGSIANIYQEFEGVEIYPSLAFLQRFILGCC